MDDHRSRHWSRTFTMYAFLAGRGSCIFFRSEISPVHLEVEKFPPLIRSMELFYFFDRGQGVKWYRFRSSHRCSDSSVRYYRVISPYIVTSYVSVSRAGTFETSVPCNRSRYRTPGLFIPNAATRSRVHRVPCNRGTARPWNDENNTVTGPPT